MTYKLYDLISSIRNCMNIFRLYKEIKFARLITNYRKHKTTNKKMYGKSIISAIVLGAQVATAQ